MEHEEVDRIVRDYKERILRAIFPSGVSDPADRSKFIIGASERELVVIVAALYEVAIQVLAATPEPSRGALARQFQVEFGDELEMAVAKSVSTTAPH